MGKVPSQYSRDRARSAHFQKGQLTLAPKLRLTDRILGDWPRSFLNPDPLPTWGLVRVGRTPGTASLTPESGVRGHSFAFMEPEPKSRPDPPEMTRGPGWARVKQRRGPVCIILAVTGPRHDVSFCLGDPLHRLWVCSPKQPGLGVKSEVYQLFRNRNIFNED